MERQLEVIAAVTRGGMDTLVRRRAHIRGVRGFQAELVEQKRVGEVRVRTDRDMLAVCLNDGVDRREPHVRQCRVVARRGLHRIQLDARGWRNRPAFQHRSTLDESFAQECDRADIRERARHDARGLEPLPAEMEHHEGVTVPRHGPEEPGLGIRHHVHGVTGEVVAEDVRHPGIVGTPPQLTSVGVESEACGYCVPEIPQRARGGVPAGNTLELKQSQGLTAADLGERGRQLPAIGRDIEVVGVEPVRQGPDELPVTIRRLESHQRRDAVQVSHPPQRLALPVERQIADASVVEQSLVAAGGQVVFAQVAPVIVVCGVEQLACIGVEGQRRHEVEGRPFDLLKPKANGGSFPFTSADGRFSTSET